MEKKKFYVTTAIDYVNAEPHIGHAYQKIAADVIARWNRLIGNEVLFVTGTDEHGKKVSMAAEKERLSVKEFTDKYSKKFKEAWNKLNIKPTRFIRTTDDDHKKVVHEVTEKIRDKGDIYKGKYSGHYCTGCEAYYTERDAVDGKCPIHKKDLETLKEETYFFKLSKYQNFLLEFYDNNLNFILPKQRRIEVINRVKEGLKDLSITRTSIDWGIPVKFDDKHVFYVWWEALINYYTATKLGGMEKFWPADLHILGVDNMWFHTVIWPAMLKSADIDLPKSVYNHGFLTFNGQKISKSLGNSISPLTLIEKYGADTIRYFVLRHFPFGEEGDFDETALIERHNNELANKLGNLVSRVTALAEKYGLKNGEIINSNKLFEEVNNFMRNYELDKALGEVFTFIDKLNEFIQIEKPWETGNSAVLYTLANGIKDITILLYSFMPNTCEKISDIFNFNLTLEDYKNSLKLGKIKKSDILFKKK